MTTMSFQTIPLPLARDAVKALLFCASKDPPPLSSFGVLVFFSYEVYAVLISGLLLILSEFA